MVPTEPPPLDELVFEFLERVDDGRAPPGAVLRSLCAEWPARAEALRSAVGSLADSGLLVPHEDSSAEQFGPYRIGRQLGSGGMGVVHLAWREGEERPVALKLLRADQLLEPRARGRFEREIRAAASLDHPNIVHVLEHGVHVVEHGLHDIEHGVRATTDGARGAVERPWVALDYHRGGSLDRVVRAHAANDPARLGGADLLAAVGVDADPLDLPSTLRGAWWEVVCRVTREVARALAHAHARGVVHRDVKPSNVLVTPEGRVMLLDFGLASLRGASRLTLTGTQVGSLPYMSPEQVRGEVVADERTDVYSLAVTAFELLTMRLPFYGADPERLGLAITTRSAPRPSKVATGHPPEAAAALDAVLGCAMAPDPRHRYASAEAFAADLTALLHGRSVAARPPTALRRTANWIRRQPYVAATVALALVVAIGGPLAYGALTARHSAEMERALDATLGHLAQLVEAVDSGLRELADGALHVEPQLLDARRAAVERALQILSDAERDSAASLQGNDARRVAMARRIAASRAQLQRSRADVLYDLGQREAALPDYGAAAETLRHLLREDPSDLRTQRGLAACLAQHARALLRLARYDEVEPLIDESVALYDAPAGQGEDQRRRTSNLAAALLVQASHRHAVGRLDEQLSILVRSRELMDEVHAAGAPDWLDRSRLGEARQRLATALAADPLVAVEHLEASLVQLGAAIEAVPRHATVRTLIVEARIEAAIRTAQLGRTEEALRHAAVAEEVATQLAEERPDDPQLQRYLVSCRALGGYLAVRSGDVVEGFATMRQALSVARERHAATGASRDGLQLLLALSNLANQLVLAEELGPLRLAEATALADEAVDLTASLAPAALGPNGHRIRCTVRYNAMIAHARADHLKAAAAHLAELEAVALAADPTDQRCLADAHCEHYLALSRASAEPSRLAAAREAALTALEHAVATGYRDLNELTTTPALDPFRADPRFGTLLGRLR